MPLSSQISSLATRIAQEVKLKADKTDPRFTSVVSSDRMPLVTGTPVAESFTTTAALDASLGSVRNVSSNTATLAVSVPTNPTDRQVLRVAVYRSSGVTVTLNGSIRLSTGISSRSFTVGSGQVLFLALEYSSFISAWTCTAGTVSAT